MSLRHPHSHGRDDTRHVSSRCRTVYAHRDAVIISVIPACEAVIQFRISHLCALCSSFPRKRESRDFSRLPLGPRLRGDDELSSAGFPGSRLRGDDGRAEVRYTNFRNEVLGGSARCGKCPPGTGTASTALSMISRQIPCPAISPPCEELSEASIVVVSDHGTSFLD
jgi:hypothetical protein